jgi:DNA polymerase elongation subunit (family B)
LMGYKFKKNSLKCIAETMNLETQKGDIDYKIFHKTSWTPEETLEIKKYLRGDIKTTKEMFDKLWEYWKPFTNLLYPHDIKKLVWIRSSIASLIYMSVCFIMNTEATFAEHTTIKEEMGGRVIEPKYEEVENAWYIDFASLYPHIFCQFNLFAETTETVGNTIWHGNDVFNVRGYYNIANQHILSKAVQEKLKQRTELKRTDPDNPMIHTIKIFVNGLYGIARSSIFEKVHTPNCGWDCCDLGQQIQKLTESMMDEFGFETVAGDTDSLFVVAKEEKDNNREYVEECLEKVVNKIKDNAPFPVDTFKMDIENFLSYVLFPFSDQPIVDPETGKNMKKGNRLVKVRKGKKKNYAYIYEKDGVKDVKLVGLPIMKDNSTKLGIKVFNEVLKPIILEKGRAKFEESFIEEKLEEYFQDDKILQLLCIEYKVKPFAGYKNPSQIQAQISKEYFNGGDGVINLLKNRKIGNVGKATKYCTAEEAIHNQLTVKDLDLDKIYNELEPFIKHEES